MRFEPEKIGEEASEEEMVILMSSVPFIRLVKAYDEHIAKAKSEAGEGDAAAVTLALRMSSLIDKLIDAEVLFVWLVKYGYRFRKLPIERLKNLHWLDYYGHSIHTDENDYLAQNEGTYFCVREDHQEPYREFTGFAVWLDGSDHDRFFEKFKISLPADTSPPHSPPPIGGNFEDQLEWFEEYVQLSEETGQIPYSAERLDYIQRHLELSKDQARKIVNAGAPLSWRRPGVRSKKPT